VRQRRPSVDDKKDKKTANTEPLFEFLDDLFELTSRGWVRKQALGVAKNFSRLAFNGSLDTWVKQQVEGLTTADSVAGLVDGITSCLWPEGQLYQKAQPQTPEEEVEYRKNAEALLVKNIPGSLKMMLVRTPHRE
jgi:hypothetical protein